MSIYAIIVGGKVSNTAIADAPVDENWILLDGMIPFPGVGWSYDGSTFTSPSYVEAVYYSLPVKSFWKRFTTAEREALQNILATGTQTQKNKLNAFRDYILTGGNVELIDDYIITSINLMETAGVIGSGRADVILNTPITRGEV
jgi:hypothetical protein